VLFVELGDWRLLVWYSPVVDTLRALGETVPDSQPFVAPEWTTGWAELLAGVVSLCILMGILMWVYHSMQKPRLHLGTAQAALPGDTETPPKSPVGEPTVSWEAAVRYLATTAVAMMVWYLALLVILTFATSDRSGEQIALGAAVVIGAARLLAHINPEASHEIARTIPLVIVSIILIGGSAAGESIVTVLTEIEANSATVDNYYVLLLITDILITTVWALLVRSRWRARQPGSRRREIRKSLAPLRESLRSIRSFGRPETPYDWRSGER